MTETTRSRGTWFAARWVKRLRLARRFRVLPWRIPVNAVRYVSLRAPSEAQIARGREIAKKLGRS